jgi:hypothetical protein
MQKHLQHKLQTKSTSTTTKNKPLKTWQSHPQQLLTTWHWDIWKRQSEYSHKE